MVKKDEKLGWRIGTVIIIVLFGLFIASIAWFFYEGSPKEIVSVADQFKPRPEWKLTQESVEPPRNFCVDVACPSIIRKWEANEVLNQETVESLIKQSGWKLTAEEDCLKITPDRPSSWCDIRGKVNGYTISLDIHNRKNASNKSTIYLYIEN